MKILVTGGAGFIGSNIVDEYIRLGHRVTVLDNFSSGKKKNLNPNARLVRASVQSPRLKELFKRSKFDVVSHHAAQIDVRHSVSDPLNDASINVMGLLNVLEQCRSTKVKKVIFSASGGTFYGECPRPAREEQMPNPLSPYGVTKLTGEYYLRAYKELFGLNYTVLRYGNVFGPRQDPHGEAGVVAIFSQRMLRKEPVLIFGDGRQQRDYIYVKDVVRANVLALRKGNGHSFNIGTQQATSVNQLFTVLKKSLGYKKAAVRKQARPGELFRSVLNTSKARRVLGWKPSLSVNAALRETADYFRQQEDR